MDIETSFLFDGLLCYVLFLLAIISIAKAIFNKVERAASIGFALLFSLVAIRILADFNYIRLSINGHRYEGIVLFVLLMSATALIVIGNFLPFLKNWMEKKTVKRRTPIVRVNVNDSKSTSAPNGENK